MMSKYFGRWAAPRLALCALVALSSCAGPRGVAVGEVPFRVMEHYYFAGDTLPGEAMMTRRSVFDRYYGMAAVMGRGGQPEVIDFSRRFAVGVVLPLTHDETEVRVRRVSRQGDTLRVGYEVRVGRRGMTSTMRPMTLITLDRRYLAPRCVLVREY